MAGKLRIKKGDTVTVISGKYKGKRGKVLRTEPATGRVVVEGVNIVKKHQRPGRGVMQGGIITQEAPIDASNVLFYCSKCSEPTRLGAKKLEDGSAARTCKRCGEVVDR